MGSLQFQFGLSYILIIAGVLLLAVNAAVSLTVRRLERRERTAATRGTDAAGGGA